MAVDPRHSRLARMDRLSHLLDNQFRIPGTGFRFGLDGLLGLLPGVGDVAAAALSTYVILEARRAGVRIPALIRMGVNVGADLVIGSVPLLGDAVDFFWKANRANLRLAQRDIEAQENRDR
ncbi:MAG: DUF4112 domain-containing protein [Rhodospirillales bacterium]